MRRGALLALVLLLGWPAAVDAAYPGANGTIAFTNGAEINVVNPDGTGEQTLGNAPFTEVLGYSPDGTKIAFSVDGAIYMANSDATGATDLNLHPGLPAGGVTWSPDGQTVMAGGETFSSEDGYADRIRKSRIDGSSDGVLVSDQANAPSWSVGGRIVFAKVPGGAISYDGRNELWTMDPDGGAQTPLGTTGGAPDWSPDGHRIAFAAFGADGTASTSQIWVINSDGTGKVELTNVPGVSDRYPAWSPDGRKIAFVRNDHVWVMNFDGTAQVDITPNDTGADRDPTWQPVPYTGYVRPRGARPFHASLVPAYVPCAAPNRTHGAPLAFPACSPPTQASGFLTLGTPDANGQPANGIASVSYVARTGDATIAIAMRDVRSKTGLADYTGEVQVVSDLRITDRANSPGPGPGTVQDTQFPVTVSCTGTAAATLGSDCNLTTTVNAVSPGALTAGLRSVWELGQVRVYDGGSDGLASTASDNTLFLTQGVFIP